MKPHLILIAAAMIASAGSALAQSGKHCYTDDDDQDTRICEWNDGSAFVITTIGSDEWSQHYNRERWKAHKAEVMRKRESAACAAASDAQSNEYVNTEAWLAAKQKADKACGRF